MSVREKIILIASSMTLLAAFLIGSFALYRVKNLTIDTSINNLAGETRLMSLKFKETFNQMRNDVLILHQMPALDAIIESQNQNNAPHDEHAKTLAKTSLSTVFSSVMTTRPYYTQMRYIGLGDNGRELVRVNRKASGLERVLDDDLQSKGNEPYFSEALNLKKGQIYFSEVSYNREHGQLDERLTPTIRTLTPVYRDGQLFGIIVINSDYEQLLEQAFKEIAPLRDTFIVNEVGDFAEYQPDDDHFIFELHDNSKANAPDFVTIVKQSLVDEQVFEDAEKLTYFVKLYINQNYQNAFLAIGLRAEKEALLKGANKTQKETLFLIIAIGLISILIAILMAQQLTEPLREMTDSIRQAKFNNLNHLNLPVHLTDEIGDLARAFSGLARNLYMSEAKARDVLDNVIDGIITVNANGIIQTINPACERLFAYKAEEIIGKNVKMLIPEFYRARFDRAMRDYVQANEKGILGVGREVTVQRKDGAIFPVELSISETMIAGRHVFTGVLRDITERKQVEVMKDEFISTVNHELRTPLASILTSLGLLRADLEDTLNEEDRHILEIAYRNCERLSELVNDILDSEKIAAGKMEYTIQEVEMVSLVKDIVDHNHGFATKHKIKFLMTSDIKAAYCQVDINRFNQALVNILSNAAKFSPPGETVSVTVKAQGTDKIKISVSDKGPGIPETFKPKIFTKFAQADGSSTRKKTGTGLGLNITKSIIEALDGEITFNSIESIGTTFDLLLPARVIT